MPSTQKFVDYIIDQIGNAGEITAKKMFGEYGLYLDVKLIGLICDDKLFIKPTNAGRQFIGPADRSAAVPGCKAKFFN